MKQGHRHEVPSRGVAPHAGAWIETKYLWIPLDANKSPPTRGRGLKRRCGWKQRRAQVAPHAGAWIETNENLGSFAS